jgi:PAS domain S-box-containing protein
MHTVEPLPMNFNVLFDHGYAIEILPPCDCRELNSLHAEAVRTEHSIPLEQTPCDQCDRLQAAMQDYQYSEVVQPFVDEHYRQVVENSPNAIFSANSQGQIQIWNRACTQIYRYSRQEMAELSMYDLMPSTKDVAIVTAFMQQVFQGKTLNNIELTYRCRDGSLRYALSRLYPLYNSQGEVHSCLFANTDITERKQAELALQASNAELITLFASIDQLILVLDREGHHLKIWTTNNNLLYRPVEQRLGKTIHDIFPSDKADFFLASIHTALDTNTTIEVDYSLELENGEQVWSNASISPIDGNTVVWVVRDVTHRKALEHHQAQLYQQVQQLNSSLEQQVAERTAQLKESLDYEATLKRITDKVRDSLDEAHILQTVVQELVTSLDVYGCDTALYDLEQRISTIAYEAVRERMLPAQKQQFSMDNMPDVYSHLLRGQWVQFCMVVPSDGSIRGSKQEYAMLCCPMMNDRGVLGDLWLFKSKEERFNDLEIRLVQQVANQCAIALRQSRLYQASQHQVEELARVNRLKDDFLSTVSHELRTPMSTIKMAIQMLEVLLKKQPAYCNESHSSEPSADRAKLDRYLKILNEESNREIELINDLLDLTRLESGAEPPIVGTVHLQDWIPNLAEGFVQRTSAQHQQLVLQIPDDLPPLITDQSHLGRILTELLHNACKYTPAGELIRVEVENAAWKVQDDAGQVNSEVSQVDGTGSNPLPSASNPLLSCLQITVTNTGVMIAPEELPRIFDKFYRIPSHDPWKHSGTGLGLALVKKLVEYLHGSIRVESNDGQTSFILTLPTVLHPILKKHNRG